jgi:hypothetical protein
MYTQGYKIVHKGEPYMSFYKIDVKIKNHFHNTPS